LCIKSAPDILVHPIPKPIIQIFRMPGGKPLRLSLLPFRFSAGSFFDLTAGNRHPHRNTCTDRPHYQSNHEVSFPLGIVPPIVFYHSKRVHRIRRLALSHPAP